MKISIIVGTRPEIIKLAPLINLIEEKKIDYFIIHSNQHYSKNMDLIFFNELNLPKPKYNLGIGSAEHGNQTGKMLIKIEQILIKEKPSIFIAQGDTNTVLAGILAASKMNIPCAHVEAGLRSYDRRMPEEKNRVICDVLSDYLFVPTYMQKNILINEGIPSGRIFVVGNTIVDSVFQNKKIAEKKSKILKKYQLLPKKYVLLTAHRSLNVDSKDSLKKLKLLIENINKFTKLSVIFPIHPRTLSNLRKYKLNFKNVKLIEPVGYLDFLNLEMNANLIITDSGGVQEEACILHVPCITIRENTERPETVEIGANKIVGLDMKKFKNAVYNFQKHQYRWINPLGDGTTSNKILEVLQSNL